MPSSSTRTCPSGRSSPSRPSVCSARCRPKRSCGWRSWGATNGCRPQRAYELGMVSQVVDPPERLREAAQELGETIARNSPAAMAATKRALWGALEMGLTDACRAGARELVGHLGPPRPAGGPQSVRREAGAAVAGPVTVGQLRGTSRQTVDRKGSGSRGSPRTTLADDVLVDLGRAALDRVRPTAQHPRTSAGRPAPYPSAPAAGSPGTQASASRPSRSTASSCARWFSAPWCTLPIELSGPGDHPARTWARTRWFVQSRMRSSA